MSKEHHSGHLFLISETDMGKGVQLTPTNGIFG